MLYVIRMQKEMQNILNTHIKYIGVDDCEYSVCVLEHSDFFFFSFHERLNL